MNRFLSKDNDGIWTPLHIRSIDFSANSKSNQLSNSIIDGSGGSLLNINGENIKLENLDLFRAGNGFIDMGVEGLNSNEKSKDVIINNVTLKNVKLENTNTQGEGIFFEGEGLSASNIIADNIEIGFIIQNSTKVSINNVIVKNLINKRTNGGLQTNGIFLQETNSVSINGLIAEDVPNYGISVRRSENVIITSSIFKSCGTNSITLIESSNVSAFNSDFDNSAIMNYSRFFVTDQYSNAGNCNEIKVINCWFNGTSNTHGISLNNSINTYCFNNSGQAAVCTTLNTNQAILSNGNNNINYRTPLVWGEYSIWIDSVGTLRLKNGNPTQDTDGSVVGTQV